MTREEAIKMLANTKVYVDGKSREIQEKLFSLGFYWTSGSKQVLFEEKPFLFLWKDVNMRYSDDMEYFTKNLFREITAADILSIVIDDPKYRPFKDAEECLDEMEKHICYGYVKYDNTYLCINALYSSGAMINDTYKSYIELLNQSTFADGAPFRINED